MATPSTSGPGVIPGNGPGAGYVRKGWIVGLSLGLFALALTLLGLLFWKWPADDCTACTMLSTSATAKTADKTPRPNSATGATETSAGSDTTSDTTTDTSTAPNPVSDKGTGQAAVAAAPAAASGPQITRVSPACGDTAGGMLVEISGMGFTEKTQVRFGEIQAKEITVIAPTTLLARSPAHDEGTVDVSAQDDSGTGKGLSTVFTYKSCIGQQAILFLVLLAGALGGTLSSIRSLYWYVGNRDLKWSWVPMYAFRPLTGTALACIFFLCVNGGIVSSQNPSNRLWIIGLSALVGLFSAQGYEKLKKIFEAIFTEVPPAADKPLPASTVTVVAVNPNSGLHAGGDTVTITGTGFVPGTTVQVLFGTTASPRVVVNNPTSLSVEVPPAANAGPVDVAVTSPGSPTVTLPQGFTYT